MSDSAARSVLRDAFALRSITPTLPELQAVGAIARFEGGYGGGWEDAGIGSNNWGAVQCGHRAPCGPGCFEYGDSDAAGEKYRGCFRRYASPAEGAADLIRELYRRAGVPEAMRAGNATAIAQRMRDTGYFEAAADKYALAIERNAAELAANLGESAKVRRGGLGGGVTPPPKPSSSSDDGAGAGFVLLCLFWGLRARNHAQKVKRA